MYIENPKNKEKENALKRFFSSFGRHIKVLLIAAGFSTIIYGGIYLVMMLTNSF
ncbi:MAG: hypothetical protein P8H03_02745 [Emcibacteraceae bacterium]|nr:hypothetical protein [Emcibacteraceae bacterium]